MVKLSTWTAALTIGLLAACSDGGGGGGGGGGGDRCDWFVGPNCWKTVAAAATACTDRFAFGTFNGATTTCSYADGTIIQFDPSASATASYHQDVPWDFTVVSSTATTCVDYAEAAGGRTLTVAGVGTYSESWTENDIVITCPGGVGGITMTMEQALNSLSNCNSDIPGMWTGGSSLISFGFWGLGTTTSDVLLWACR